MPDRKYRSPLLPSETEPVRPHPPCAATLLSPRLDVLRLQTLLHTTYPLTQLHFPETRQSGNDRYVAAHGQIDADVGLSQRLQ